MTKLLIISYFYPPANFVGGERTAAWARYLHENGFYPIIITRQWNDWQTDLIDKVQKNTLEVEYNGTHEVHRLPYKYSLRDRCARYKWLKPLQKAFTLLELIGSNFFIRALPYSNFYFYSKDLIKRKNDISIVIASGRPFQSFFIGHKLKNDYPKIHWIPDYRDEWTTHNHKTKGIYKFISFFDQSSEKKWISNATFFTTVSMPWRDNIQTFINRDGKIVLNGYNELEPIRTSKSKNLRLSYVGSLYESQKIEMIISSVISVANVKPGFIEFTFIGINANQSELIRVEKLIKGYENVFNILPRVSKEELNRILVDIDVLVLTGFEKIKGWYPVKLFHYFSIRKPILLYPSDNDVISDFIKKTNSGYIPEGEEECRALLLKLLEYKSSSQSLTLEIKGGAEFFSRSAQTAILAKHLSSLLHEK